MKNKTKIGLYLVGVILLTVLIGGTIFYKYSEQLNWLDALYSTALLMSTAGLGTLVPTHISTKIFTIIYVVLGVPMVLFCFGYILEWAFKSRMQDIEMEIQSISNKNDEILKNEKTILEGEEKILKSGVNKN